ncbi:MAG: aminotransferase class V-fold PLP-dependent enzyme [Flavobacteriaceae bacterium]|nr:aminotransferase class V-fold PLP-dependent enzyme [Flavobacteriaceae bacterium]
MFENNSVSFKSESKTNDNFIIKCAVRDLEVKRIISSAIEHHAVVHTCEEMRDQYGVALDYVNLDEKGNVDIKHLEELLTSSGEKTLVSLMHINNELGNILDIDRVAELCQENNALFHSDTVQGVCHYPIDLEKTRVDFIVGAAHKFHGPKGVGFAFIRKGIGMKPLIHGGSQERGSRAGTESVHNIVGLDEAFKCAYENLEADTVNVKGIKHYFIEEITNAIPNIQFNGESGDLDKSTYTLVNTRLPVSPEKALTLLFQLDIKGIACSKGSACQSGSGKGSHVLTAILPEEEMLKPSVRFSFSKHNTKEEVDYVVGVLKEFINS